MKLLPLLFLVATACSALAADAPSDSFTGHYELAKKSKSAFSLDVLQDGKTAKISFSAGNENGSGAAPDGDGEGKANDKGELEIHWTDSFENDGTAVLKHSGKLVVFAMKPGKVSDPRALALYGNVTLKRTSAKPEMSTR